ncbi:type II toxin-antitoxin system VapC family toxin [Amycolatopsis taiwanensis]|uniref:Ribonuclease VapC n=1 Tax=Amycolatopsis taiwanensis TaxID=342230 RepID=A0A9W6QWL1_9PSEU|nr:type II toxin-antitoxin system VapC family toxin [Amycolatopsis taiwanensis]GLY63407.1 hypothetical protein Atai01_00260 [Amycolatopsis taiwanensis]
MIAYFDTSALLPLLLQEPGTPGVRRLWGAASARVSSRLLYVEASAVLTQARHAGRLTDEQWRDAVELLDGVWDHLDVVNVGEALVNEAAQLARHRGLRGYAAVHCASARRFVGDDVVVVSGDQQLLATCRQLGMATANAG